MMMIGYCVCMCGAGRVKAWLAMVMMSSRIFEVTGLERWRLLLLLILLLREGVERLPAADIVVGSTLMRRAMVGCLM